MDFEYKKIPLSRIDGADQTFKIGTDDSIEMLKRSIRHLGIIHPPILIEKPISDGSEPSYVTVTGFRVIQACRELGMHEIGANCLDVETPFHRCALVAIGDKYLDKKLNPVEQARCLALIEKAGEKRGEALEIFQAMGGQPNDEMMTKLKKINGMGGFLKTGLIEGAIALPVALDLCDMPDGDGARALAELLIELRVSLNRQREMVDWIQAVACRERMDIGAVLADEAIRRLRNDETLDAPRKAKLIRDHLRSRRYPEITAYERKYADVVKSLSLKKNIHLIPPSNFESASYSLKIDFKSVDELLQRTKNAMELSQSPSLATLFKPTRS